MTTGAARMSHLRTVLVAMSSATIITIGFGASAQDYPARNIRVVVPWPPGGLVDIAARTVTDKAKDELKQGFIIENRAGAGGSIGAAAVAKAEPNGYTLMFTTSGLTMNASMGKAPYDVVRDFTPILHVANAPLVLVTNKALKVGSVSDLVALAKAKPGELTSATAGLGSPAHFTTELFRQRTGISIAQVHYKGAPEAMNGLIGERIAFQFTNATVGIPQIQAGTIKALAITSDQRSRLVPDIPTMKEAGFVDFKADQWLGFLAPANLPKAVVTTLVAALQKALGSEEVRATLTRSAMEPESGSTPESFAALLKSDMQNWTEVAKASNLTAN